MAIVDDNHNENKDEDKAQYIQEYGNEIGRGWGIVARCHYTA